MPGRNYAPIPAMLGEFDARQWADGATSLFTRGGVARTLPTTSYAVYEDALAFLNGFGVPNTTSAAQTAQAQWTAAGAAGTITIDIGPDDRLFIQTSAQDFTISANPDNTVFGFDAAGHGLVGGAAPYRRTAPAEWVRGNIRDRTLLIVPQGIAATVVAPQYNNLIQSVVTALRSAAQGDADDVSATPSLEAADNLGGVLEYRWGIDATGHVWTSRPQAVGAAVVWVDTAFRDRIGFDGTEVEVSSGASRVLTAARPMPGVYVPTRPLETIERRIFETTPTALLTSGDVAANHVSSTSGWRAVYYVDGPADSRDTSRHFVERCLRDHWRKGSALTLYQEWGDPRRALASWQVDGADAYGLLYTSEFDGYRGRLRCRIDPATPDERTLAWPGRLRRRVPVDILLRDRV